jgi:hypothetical protein
MDSVSNTALWCTEWERTNEADFPFCLSMSLKSQVRASQGRVEWSKLTSNKEYIDQRRSHETFLWEKDLWWRGGEGCILFFISPFPWCFLSNVWRRLLRWSYSVHFPIWTHPETKKINFQEPINRFQGIDCANQFSSAPRSRIPALYSYKVREISQLGCVLVRVR